MSLRSLEDAFLHELKDLLSAEKQLVSALPKMAKNAHNPQLKECFESHLRETEQQINRLEQIFDQIGKTPRAEKCKGMVGIIDEGKQVMKEEADPDVMDAIMIAEAQKVEHYEIAGYGTCCVWAEMLGHHEAANLLKETLREEKAADEKLTQIAMEAVNRQAVGAASQ